MHIQKAASLTLCLQPPADTRISILLLVLLAHIFWQPVRAKDVDKSLSSFLGSSLADWGRHYSELTPVIWILHNIRTFKSHRRKLKRHTSTDPYQCCLAPHVYSSTTTPVHTQSRKACKFEQMRTHLGVMIIPRSHCWGASRQLPGIQVESYTALWFGYSC